MCYNNLIYNGYNNGYGCGNYSVYNNGVNNLSATLDYPYYGYGCGGYNNGVNNLLGGYALGYDNGFSQGRRRRCCNRYY